MKRKAEEEEGLTLARKQTKSRPGPVGPAKDSSNFNIWYNKYTGDGDRDQRHAIREERHNRAPQLDILRDCGITKGNSVHGRFIFVLLFFLSSFSFVFVLLCFFLFYF